MFYQSYSCPQRKSSLSGAKGQNKACTLVQISKEGSHFSLCHTTVQGPLEQKQSMSSPLEVKIKDVVISIFVINS